METADRETLTGEAVVAAARDQIRTKGLDAVSLRQVGAALGVTAPALYAYVTDKRDLLRAVAEDDGGQPPLAAQRGDLLAGHGAAGGRETGSVGHWLVSSSVGRPARPS